MMTYTNKFNNTIQNKEKLKKETLSHITKKHEFFENFTPKMGSKSAANLY